MNFFFFIYRKRRPITIHERVPFTTTPATTTTTTEPEYESEEASTVVNRLSRLTLPSNATSIRSDITDNFSCAGRSYGYYADVENDCQLFHVCLPVTYPDGQERQFRWSFICPEETTFNQVRMCNFYVKHYNYSLGEWFNQLVDILILYSFFFFSFSFRKRSLAFEPMK